MRRWEYREISITRAIPDMDGRMTVFLDGPGSIGARQAILLSDMDAEGWQLMAVITERGYDARTYLFRREVGT